MSSTPTRGALATEPPKRATYRYAALAFAMVAAPTDVIVIQGAANKTIRVKRVALSGAATAAGTMPVQLVRRSTAGTLGSAVLTVVAAAKHDSEFVAPTATVSTVGTANYTTLGTIAGVVATGRMQMTALATGLGVTPIVWDFSNREDYPVVLRGVLEHLCVNFNAAAIPAGGVIDYEIEIEEDHT